MLAWELRSFDLASLALAERPSPQPAAGEVLVDIASVALNYRDLAIAFGLYAPNQKLPLVPASDACGTISAVGPGVTAWRVGDRVISCYTQGWDRGPSQPSDKLNTLGSPLDGVLCEQRAFPQHSIVRAPDNLTDEECATLPIAGVTAWCSLFEHGAAQPGECVLVQGSGGVSTFAIQLAAAAGLRVIAVSRSAEKLATARKLGASTTIDSSAEPDWGETVFNATGGADVILDVGGEATLEQSANAAAQNGRIVAIGFLGGIAPKLALGAFITKNLTLRGITVGSACSFRNLLRFIDQHGIKPVIDSTFPFGDAPSAFARLGSGAQHGKICIKVGANA